MLPEINTANRRLPEINPANRRLPFIISYPGGISRQHLEQPDQENARGGIVAEAASAYLSSGVPQAVQAGATGSQRVLDYISGFMGWVG